MNTNKTSSIMALTIINLSSLAILSPIAIAQEYSGCFMISQSGELINLSEFCSVAPKTNPNSPSAPNNELSNNEPAGGGGGSGAPEIPQSPDSLYPSSPEISSSEPPTPVNIEKQRLSTPAQQQIDRGGGIPTFNN